MAAAIALISYTPKESSPAPPIRLSELVPFVMSPDGRSHLLFRTGSPFTMVSIGDFASGTAATLIRYTVIGDGRQALANGPVALLISDNGPVLWKAGQFIPLTLQRTPTQGRLNSLADTIVYEAATTTYELHSYSISSGKDILLASGGKPPTSYLQPNPFFGPSLTYDGKLVSYLVGGQVTLESTDGTGLRTLTDATDGVITEALISGSGNVIFAVASNGRLLRIDVATGAKTELIAAVPQFSITGGVPVPGAPA